MNSLILPIIGLVLCLIVLGLSMYVLSNVFKLAKLADEKQLELFEKYRKEKENANS